MAIEGYDLGTAYARVLLDSSSLDKSIDSTQKKFKDFGKGMQAVGTSLLGLTAPLVAFGGAAVNAFNENQLALAQLDQVLKSTAGSAGVTHDMAVALASSLETVTMYSDETVLSTENLLLTFTNISSNIFPTVTQTALDMATALGEDTSSAAMQLGKALNSPIEGVGALRRVGVQLSDSQEALVKSLMAVGDTAGAQQVILGELRKEFGGSAVAAGDTFAGGLAKLGNQLNNILETVGAALIPVLQNMIDKVAPIINQIAEWISKNPELIAQIAQVVLAVFALGTILTLAGTVITTVTTVVGALTGAIALLLSPAGILIALIAGIVYVASQLYPGGLQKLFLDASTAASQLGVILFGVGGVAKFITDQVSNLVNTLMKFQDSVNSIAGIVNLVSSGQVSFGQVVNATVGEITANAGGSSAASRLASQAWANQAPIQPSSGSNTSHASIQGGDTHNYQIQVYANDAAGGAAAGDAFKKSLEDRFRGRGN